MKISALALTACLIVIGSPASATLVNVEFHSTDGDELSGIFGYDTAYIPYIADITQGCCSGYAAYHDNFDMAYDLNGVGYSTPVQIMVESGPTGTEIDVLSLAGYPYVDVKLLGLSTFDLNVNQLPTDFSPTLLPVADTSFNYQPAGTTAYNDQVHIPISTTFIPYTPVSGITPLPELSAWASMLVGLGLVGGLAWWQRGRWKPAEFEPSFA